MSSEHVDKIENSTQAILFQTAGLVDEQPGTSVDVETEGFKYASDSDEKDFLAPM